MTDSLVEQKHQPAYISLATATPASSIYEKSPWPVTVKSIGHNTASYQNYGSEPYFHHGLDIRADAGSEVVPSASGQVVNISNYGPGPAYWEVAILDNAGFL
jgi:murein DD-endopeptidase MepM/ murein hydrolase activator NlpD